MVNGMFWKKVADVWSYYEKIETYEVDDTDIIPEEEEISEELNSFLDDLFG